MAIRGAPNVPAEPPHPILKAILLCERLYVQVADATGEYEMRMELIGLEDERMIGGGATLRFIADRMDAGSGSGSGSRTAP
jgi:hypothetical protein